MHWHRGIAVALTAAALFGIGTPLAKLLLAEVSPWMPVSYTHLDVYKRQVCVSVKLRPQVSNQRT